MIGLKVLLIIQFLISRFLLLNFWHNLYVLHYVVSDDEDEEVAANLTLDVEKLVVQVGSTTLDSQP